MSTYSIHAAKSQRDRRWWFDFNVLDTLDYFATAERAVGIDAGILQRVHAFSQAPGHASWSTRWQWAYLYETRDRT